MVSSGGFTRLFGVSQIYIKRDKNGMIIMIAAKVTDEILLACNISDLNDFAEDISKRYKVRKIIIDDTIQFNGCNIYQDNEGNITMDMSNFLSNIKPISIDKARRKQSDEKAKKHEIYMYRSLAGSFLWIWSAVMPQSSCTASFMQQKVTRLLIRDLIDANARLKELRDLRAQIRYKTIE